MEGGKEGEQAHLDKVGKKNFGERKLFFFLPFCFSVRGHCFGFISGSCENIKEFVYHCMCGTLSMFLSTMYVC